MKKTFIPFILFIGLMISLTGCGAAGDAEKCAEKFFSHLIKQDFEKAGKYLSANVRSMEDTESQLKAMAENPQDGKLLSVEKSLGFNTQIRNGITTVELPYSFTYEKGVYDYEVVIVDRGAGYKIESIN